MAGRLRVAKGTRGVDAVRAGDPEGVHRTDADALETHRVTMAVPRQGQVHGSADTEGRHGSVAGGQPIEL